MLKGSCLCNRITYQVDDTAKQINLCHCKMCQKFHGSAFGSYTRVLSKHFQFLTGASLEKTYDSSSSTQRSFCLNCGSSLRYINKDKPQFIYIATGTFDEGPHIKPSQHIFVKNKADWYEIDEEIPQAKGWRDLDL